MLPKAERLSRSGLIQKTYSGRRISTELFNLYALSRRGSDTVGARGTGGRGSAGSAANLPRVAFVVGKKVHARAVRRNLVKRRLREAYRQIRKDLPELGRWYSMVLVGRAKIDSVKWSEVKSNLLEAIAALNAK